VPLPPSANAAPASRQVHTVLPCLIDDTHIIRGAIGGIYHTKLTFDNLPPEIKEKYHYDAKAFQEYRTQKAVLQAAQAEKDKEFIAALNEAQKIQVAQETADALKEQAIQQKRTADAMEKQAQAAATAATNPPVNNTVIQQDNTVLQIQQNQQNNYGN